MGLHCKGKGFFEVTWKSHDVSEMTGWKEKFCVILKR